MELSQSFRKLRAQFDWPLATAIVAISGIGLINLYSATRGAPRGLYNQQLIWFLVSAVIFVVVSAIDYRVLERSAYAIFSVGVVVLVFILFAGKTVKGAKRWIGIGPLGVQPSELAKIMIVLALGKLFSSEPIDLALRPWRYVAAAIGLMLLPAIAIAKQPDLGTALIVCFVAATILLLAPLPLHVRVLATFGEGLGALLLFVIKLYRHSKHDYQNRRWDTFWDPSSDPLGAGYQAQHGLLSVGSGRWFGKGYLHGLQTQLQFLPERWSDFPFAVWAEEWGFVGCAALLALYLFLILWALHLGSQARDRFGQTICVGAAAMLFWQVLLNIGMVAGILPVVGVTLPLVSYGGSSLLTVMLMLGLLMNVSIRRYSY